MTSSPDTLRVLLDSFTDIAWPNQLGLQNTLTAPLQRDKTPPKGFLDMTLNNLIVRL